MTRDEALAMLDAHPEHDEAMPFLRDWIESGDPLKIRHAVGRLGHPSLPIETFRSIPESPDRNVSIVTDDLIARLKRCPHWLNGGCSCGSDLCVFPWHRRRVTAIDCRTCLSAT